MLLDLLQGRFGQLDARWHSVRNDADAQWREGQGLRNHAPQDLGEHILAQERTVVTHGHQLDGVRMNGGLIARVGLNLTGMNGEVTGQLAGGHHGIVGNDDIRGAVVKDTDD